MAFVSVEDARLEYQLIEPAGAGPGTLVFLHEGLGWVAGWRDWPAKLATAIGCRALDSLRRGNGPSDPIMVRRGAGLMPLAPPRPSPA